jgi:glutathione synthase/RimK-type ligase-like ATP-grasp enzyme
MAILVVVNSPRDWPLRFEGAEIVGAREYLTDASYASLKGAKVFNLCRSYRYQSLGYYVSLLAEARGQKPVPSITTVLDLKAQEIVRVASGELDDTIQKAFRRIRSEDFELSVYFGHNLSEHYEKLSQSLFKLFPAPFLRAQFGFGTRSEKWYLKGIAPIAASDIPEAHRQFVLQVAHDYFSKERHPMRRRRSFRYDLAILRNPAEGESPSNAHAIEKFVHAAEALGMETEVIQKADFGRLGEFDALFIRETTAVTHHTYRFARRALAEGLVVVDDPESILKCTNKVFLAELLTHNSVPVPRTVIVHRESLKKCAPSLGFPLILKKPDSSFSQGVVKVESEAELAAIAGRLFERSELLIAQEFVPTEFDWRVGVFDRRPLYVCKYFMAPSHWQIIRRGEGGEVAAEGLFETVSVHTAPPQVVRAAVRASNLIGDGLYGVDLKQIGRKVLVIEVNDNPSIDAGVEDRVLGEGLYREVMGVILKRIERRKER